MEFNWTPSRYFFNKIFLFGSKMLTDCAMEKLLLLILFIFACAPAFADSSQPRIITVTRSVKLFSEQENALMARIQERDAAGLDKTLADNFEMTIASRPNDPISRSEWIHQSLADSNPTIKNEQMAVHEYGNIAVVSFKQSLTDENKKSEIKFFIVDIWMRSDTAENAPWKLMLRYASNAGSDDNEMQIPGIPKDKFESNLPKRS